MHGCPAWGHSLICCLFLRLFRAKPEKLTFKLLAFLLLPTVKGTEFNSSFADEVMEKVKRCAR